MFEFSPQPIDDIQGDAHVELTIARAKRLTELTAQGLGIGARVRFRVRNMAVDALAGEVKRFDDDFHGIQLLVDAGDGLRPLQIEDVLAILKPAKKE